MSTLPPEIATAVSKSSYAQKKLVKISEALDNAVSNSKKNDLPCIAVSPATGQMLSMLCKMVDAKHVLEIGTLGGYSTLWFANANEGIHVTSIEYNSKHRDVALQNLQNQKNTEVILGSALDVLPRLKDEGKLFDFVFIDASWEEQKEYFDWAVKLTRRSGCVYVDNVVRQLTESAEDDPTATALVDYVSEDGRVEASLIPTLNTDKKSLSAIADGFLMAVVK